MSAGVRGVVAHRPMTAFLVITFGVGWPVLTVPLLADRGVIGTGALPVELFALGVTWFVMLPAALGVTAVSEGPGAARDLLRRLLRWRLGAWWPAILLALPLTTVGVGLLLGGSVGIDDTAASPLEGVVLLVSAVLLIHLCEETVWAGFVQARLERRHTLVGAALLTAVPFAAIHVPIILIGQSQVLPGLGGVLVLGVAMRLLVGVFLRGTDGSLLAAGLVHAVYNTSNNDGALVDGILLDADQNLAAPIALVLVAAAAAVIARRDGTRGWAPGPRARRGTCWGRSRTHRTDPRATWSVGECGAGSSSGHPGTHRLPRQGQPTADHHRERWSDRQELRTAVDRARSTASRQSAR